MMKVKRLLPPLLVLTLAVLSIQAQDFKVVSDGVWYSDFVRETESGPIRGNLIKLDPRKIRLKVVQAMDTAIGVEKTSSIAARHGALAAVNAGFFRLDTSIWAGEAVGILKVDGRLVSESYGGRVGLGLFEDQGEVKVVIDRVTTELSLIGSKAGTLAVDGMNRERKAGEMVIFTREFGPSTLTDQTGFEVVVDEKSGDVLRRKSGGSSPIETGTFVISFTSEKAETLDSFLKSQNNKVRFTHSVKSITPGRQSDFNRAEFIVGGVGHIIQSGQTVIDWELERTSRAFYETRHPRTAFAVLKDGNVMLVTIDGRQPEHSVGLGLQELAEILKEVGAIEAINLDGGGSTAMYLDGKIVNKPSDREGERRVSDALLVFPKPLEK
jgi:exopolysaccharide biosynthesis protein